MTAKTEFNAQEWDEITTAPALAALTVMLAERGGAIRESIALGRAYSEARSAGGSELVTQLVSSPPHLDPSSMGQGRPDDKDFLLSVADVVAHAKKETGA